MLIAQMSNIKKYFQDRLILDVRDFKIYKHNKIGIIGANGSGKTTLLNVLTNNVEPDEGDSAIYGTYAYITQFGDADLTELEGYHASKLGVGGLASEGLSGGEITRLKIAKALSNNPTLIIGDEPTSNLDQEGIELLQRELSKFDGALLIASHDREFLDVICHAILEIEDGQVLLYEGNYSKYKILKDQERQRAEFEYEQYVAEKRRLQKAVEQKKNQAGTMRRTPKRMGNSEARLHKMGNQTAKAKLEQQVNAIRTRIERLEPKEKPKELPEVHLDIDRTQQLHSKVIVSSNGLNKSFGDKIIFQEAQFKVMNHSKTAIIGPNGSGKTTLIRMVVNGDPAIEQAKNARIGYFSQDIGILNMNQSLLHNVMASSLYDETYARMLLAGLLFKREHMTKKVSLLSGGERVKAAIAKIIVSDFNVLVLDEPTNYLDIHSLDAVEDALLNYQGTVIFVSHDRRFVHRLADHIISIENQKTICFDGTYEEYIAKRESSADPNHQLVDRMILQHRLTEILGKLSMPTKKDDIEALDQEYKQIVQTLRRLE